MSDNARWETRRRLTSPQNNYRRISPEMIAAYNALGGKKGKVSTSLFLSLMREKWYGDKGKEKNGDEENRIYTDIPITIDMIIREVEPHKFMGRCPTAKDRQMIRDTLAELSRDNIFQIWTYKNIYRIFFYERDIGCWLCYNPAGFLTPHSVLKITGGSIHSVDCMERFVAQRVRGSDRADIENSFGMFLDAVIRKMNPDVSADIPKWYNSCSLQEHIKKVESVLKEKKVDAGVDEHESFIERLPLATSNHLKGYRGIDMKSQVEKDITPRKATVGRKRKPRAKHDAEKIPRHVLPEGASDRPAPIVHDFADDSKSPFASIESFTKYYRDEMKSRKGDDINLNVYQTDHDFAAKIMDMMTEAKRDNLQFLNAWLKSFAEDELKGTKGRNKEYSSMKHFGSTFRQYQDRFYPSQR